MTIKMQVALNDPALDDALRNFDRSRRMRLESEGLEKDDRALMLSLLEGHHLEHNADVYRTSEKVSSHHRPTALATPASTARNCWNWASTRTSSQGRPNEPPTTRTP